MMIHDNDCSLPPISRLLNWLFDSSEVFWEMKLFLVYINYKSQIDR
jgi:hypothetical protein